MVKVILLGGWSAIPSSSPKDVVLETSDDTQGTTWYNMIEKKKQTIYVELPAASSSHLSSTCSYHETTMFLSLNIDVHEFVDGPMVLVTQQSLDAR